VTIASQNATENDLQFRKLIWMSCLVGLFSLVETHITCLAQNSPKLFAPGVISGPAHDLSPAFTPDGKTVYFTRSNGSASIIVTSTFANGQWSTPAIASFSGTWNDLEPAMAPDGSFLVLASNRPTADGGKPIDGTFNGKTYPGAGGNLWRVDRTGGGWGQPKRLPDTINTGTGVFSPAITSDGSLYFMKPDSQTGNFHLWRSQYSGGAYLAPVPAGLGDSTTEDVDPTIAPDESFIVYTANHPSKHDQKRLRIAFHKKDGWGTPVDLGDEVNEAGANVEARLGSDHRTLYFSTNTVPPVSFPQSQEQSQRVLAEMQVWANGNENIWYVSLAPWLDGPRKP
jgi:WD40-like Beta Propeller Repeat